MFGNVTDNDTESDTDNGTGSVEESVTENGTGKGRMGLHKKDFAGRKTIHFIQKRRTHYEKETFKRIT
ncbi:MAG: hypothetical protein ACI4FV_02510 [Lachnospiraceae bacterium]